MTAPPKWRIEKSSDGWFTTSPEGEFFYLDNYAKAVEYVQTMQHAGDDPSAPATEEKS